MKIAVQIDEQIGDNRVDFFVLSEIGGVKYSMMYIYRLFIARLKKIAWKFYLAVLKVSKFQNEFMKSSFLPKYEQTRSKVLRS